jgi:hypothetical protein
LDKFVEEVLIPEYTRGKRRKDKPEYARLCKQARHLKDRGQPEAAHELKKLYQNMPSPMVEDPDYRRLRYVRYADDFVLGFTGPVEEACEIKARLKAFLRERLKLELSDEKTLITHAQSEAAKFLGYEIMAQSEDTKHTHGKRSVNGVIALRIPVGIVEGKCAEYSVRGRPIHRPELEFEDDFTIVYDYQSRYRGYVQFYKLATNLAWLNRLKWVMEISLLKTLAHKHKTSVSKVARQHTSQIQTPEGPRKCIEIVLARAGKEPLKTHFGGISLARNPIAIIEDQPTTLRKPSRSELVQRLLADECEICGATDDIEVHHIRGLKDLNVRGQKEKPLWMQIMSARQRKTLVVCRSCHTKIQHGKPTGKQAH